MKRLFWMAGSAPLWVGAILLSTVPARAAELEPDLHKTFNVTPGGKLLLDVDRGSVDVNPGADDRVECHVTRKVTGASSASAAKILAAHEITFQQEGNQVIVKARLDRKAADLSFWRSPSLQVRYEIKVPQRFNTDIKTAGGGLSATGLTGEMRLQTAGGSIRCSKIDGTIWARTSGGNMSVLGATGAVAVRTSGGDIRVEDVGAAVEADTSGGSIHLRSIRGRVQVETSGGNIAAEGLGAGVRASTSGGNVTVNLTGAPEGDCVLQTSGGNIHLSVPERLSANLEAHTSGGTVTCDLPITVQGLQKRNELKGRLGEGGPLLRLHTSGGNVRLRKN